MSDVPHDNESRPAVDWQRIREQLAVLLRHERTLALGTVSRYEPGKEQDEKRARIE